MNNNRVQLRVYSPEYVKIGSEQTETSGIIPFRPVPQERWILLHHLVRDKKEIRSAESIEEYLKEYFDVPDLILVTRREVEKTIRHFSALSDKEME